MKTVCAGLLVIASFAAAGLRAADAVALAAQQEAEERQRRLAATVEEVQTAQMAQQKQISALAAEVNRLREEIAKANQSGRFEESLKRLSDQILKVDEARLADNQKIYEALEKLGAAIKSLPTPTVRPQPDRSPVAASPARPTGPPVEGEFYEYTIRSGDTLSEIVQLYNEQKIPVTLKSVLDANPGLAPEKLRIGQKIFIPKPK